MFFINCLTEIEFFFDVLRAGQKNIYQTIRRCRFGRLRKSSRLGFKKPAIIYEIPAVSDELI